MKISLFSILFFLVSCQAKIPEYKVVHKPKPELKGYLAFSKYVWPDLRRNECGECDPLCHYDQDDRGGLTCTGIAINFNPEWYVNELNSFDKECKKHWSPKQIILCKRKLFLTSAKNLLYEKYSKPFEKCGGKAQFLLSDSSVLSGPHRAIRLLQRSHNLKEDGVLGKNSIKACQDKVFNGEAFTKERIKRFEKLAKSDKYKKWLTGWTLRANRMLKKWKKLK